jgi:hypothetical protein
VPAMPGIRRILKDGLPLGPRAVPGPAGGVSRFQGLCTVRNRLLAERPELLRRLYQPAYFDRQREHAEDMPRVPNVPMFRRTADGRLAARPVPGLVQRGHGAHAPPDPGLAPRERRSRLRRLNLRTLAQRGQAGTQERVHQPG